MIGSLIGVAGYVLQFALAGPSAAFKGMVLQPIFDLRGGRKLPVPPPWDHLDGFLQRSGAIVPWHYPLPALTTSAQLTVWFFGLLAAVVFLVGVAIWAVRRDRTRFQARVLLAVALFSLGMVPQAMQRVDSAHLAWVSCVPFALLPIAVLELLRVHAPRWTFRRSAVLSGAGVLLVMVLAFRSSRPGRTRTSSRSRWAATGSRTRSSGTGASSTTAAPRSPKPRSSCWPRSRRSRSPATGSSSARRICARRRSPTRTSTTCSPSTRPATRYIEMDPGVANAKGSGLASDLRSADIAILSGAWNDWSEPNDSRKLGSDAPNRVLVKDFCVVGSFGTNRTGGPALPAVRDAPRANPARPAPRSRSRPGPDPGVGSFVHGTTPRSWSSARPASPIRSRIPHQLMRSISSAITASDIFEVPARGR